MFQHAHAAMVQFVHNLSRENIDIYIEGELQFQNLQFQKGTPFFLLPEGTWRLHIAPANSTGISAAFGNFTLIVEEGNYLFTLAGDQENPALFVHQGHQFESKASEHVGMTFVQSMTTVSTINVLSETQSILDQLAYGTASNYLTIPGDAFEFLIENAANRKAIVAHRIDLNFWRGKSIVLFTSLDEDELWQTYVLLPDGHSFPLERLALPEAHRSIDFQFIQNLLNRKVDVYLNETLLIDDFLFRQSTTYLKLPKHEYFDLGVANADSRSAQDVHSVYTFRLEEELPYLLFFNTANDSRNILPNIKSEVPETGSISSVAVGFSQAADNLPAVDVYIDEQLLYKNIAFRTISDYQLLPIRPFQIELKAAGSTQLLGAYEADFHTWRGQSAMLYTSQDSDNNFVLQAVTPDTTFTLTPISESAETSIEQRAQEAPFTSIQFVISHESVQFRAQLFERQPIQLSLLDVQGRSVRQQNFGWQTAGEVNLELSSTNLAAGIYFLEMRVGNKVKVEKVVLP